ncbi:MAG: N-acetylneuraminate synthase family protein, partial [Planctomycetota bacterium]
MQNRPQSADARRSVQLGPLTVGDGHPVTIVAELGVNHLGDAGRMREMIDAAVDAGADALKFQTYTAEARYDRGTNPKADRFIADLARWEFSREVEAELWEYAHARGATVFTSAFDPGSARFADGLGSVGYKLAAFETVNHQLVRALGELGKPVVISRGMCTHEELDECVAILERAGCPVVLLHCISSYPVQKPDSNLAMIRTLRDRYRWPIGHSDHSRGCDIPPLAVAAGAVMIEKHFTVNPKLRESDIPFSIPPDELLEIVVRVRQTEGYMGSGEF